MKKILPILLLLISAVSQAQPGWNWPEDEKMYNIALEKQAYYKVLMGQSKFEEALSVLKWLYDNNPNLNPSIYIDGTKTIDEAIELIDDKVRIAELKDSSLWMYDARIEHFGNEASVMDRKAYTAFKYYYKNPAKYNLLIELFDKAFELNGAGISSFNLTPYMMVAKYAYERKIEGVSAEKVLDVHSTLSNVMDEKEKAGKNMEDTRNKIDAFLSSIDGLLSCEFIETRLVPRLEADPNDLNTAKKVFSYSLQAKCSDQPYFLMAAETIGRNEPSYSLSKILADKWYNKGEYNKSMNQYSIASNLALDNDEAFDAFMGQAKTASKLGQKSNARNFAQQALSKKPGNKDAYTFIGNLYMTSFDDCAEKKEIVEDRAVYLAAYAMYEKAGNTKQMESAKSQFPSSEDIFNSPYEEGQSIKVNCWINTTVKIQRR